MFWPFNYFLFLNTQFWSLYWTNFTIIGQNFPLFFLGSPILRVPSMSRNLISRSDFSFRVLIVTSYFYSSFCFIILILLLFFHMFTLLLSHEQGDSFFLSIVLAGLGASQVFQILFAGDPLLIWNLQLSCLFFTLTCSYSLYLSGRKFILILSDYLTAFRL